MKGPVRMRPPQIWGDLMEIWIDAEKYETTSNNSEYRVWKGQDPEVAVVELDDFKGQDEAMSLVGLVPWVMMRCSDWKMIPLENIVAAASDSGTKVAVSISEEIDIQGVAFALEQGVDAIVIPPEELSPSLWSSALKIAEERTPVRDDRNNPELSTAIISSVTTAGLGERVCVDLTERLSDGEGIFVGSSSSCLCLVHGETVPSQYVPSRPFRVNAGAVHSYVLMGDGSTKYLCELSSGDQVAVYSDIGLARIATIGRLKIERRPLLKISLESENFTGNILVQQAETVRLVTPSGSAVSVTKIKSGDEITVLNGGGMRHIGKSIQGEVSEK